MHALRTLWRKSAREIWRNGSRTAMVVISVAIGVLAVGMIIAAQQILMHDLYARYAAINPAHISITVPGGVDVDDLRGLESLPNVAAVDGRATFQTETLGTAAERSTIEFIGLPDFSAQQINLVDPESGLWPPQRGELVLERSAPLASRVGQSIAVDASGHGLEVAVVGTAHQQDNVRSSVRGVNTAFVDLDTMRMLCGCDRVTRVYVNVDDFSRQASTAEDVRARLERAGYTVAAVTLHDPHQHVAQDILDVFMLIMTILGVLSLVLSGLLVTNTISAQVAQQTDQIGVMKAIGADPWLIIRSYGLTVFAYGILATLIAGPLAGRLGYQLAHFIANFLNVDLFPYRPSLRAWGVMIAVGLLVPVLAALRPIWSGAQLTVREAIADYGLGGSDTMLATLFEFFAKNRTRIGRIERIKADSEKDSKKSVSSAQSAFYLWQSIPRTWMLALRNSVRTPERLLLTLLTLMLGGALFMGVLATARSFDRTLDRLLTQQNAMDSLLVFKDVERVSRVVPLVESHPDVTAAEAWYSEKASMTLPDGSELEMSVLGVPQDTAFYRPDLADGVWLNDATPDGIVLNVDWAASAGVGVGDTVTLTLGDVKSTWQVVGLNRELSMAGAQDFAAVHSYASFETISRVLGRVDRTQSLRVGYTVHDAANQARISDELVDLLEADGVAVLTAQTIAQIEQRADSLYSILITVLMAMSLLMAVVGGLGLMGMMSINVLERRKEIGVMRAIGAGDAAVLQIFWGESMVVALLSYVLAVAGSVPIGRFMSRAIGLSFLKMPLDFAYAWSSLWIWLTVIAVIGTVASILPAWSAARLSVRESLSYE